MDLTDLSDQQIVQTIMESDTSITNIIKELL